MTDKSPWTALAVPFPDSEVKERPGRGTNVFRYVDARAVMNRLDDVLTPSGWDFTSTVIPGTDIVRGELTIGGVTRVDYGYPNSDKDEEPIKAASSDALKRCAVMFGIGRHLYDDNHQSGGRAAPPPARPPAPIPVRTPGTMRNEDGSTSIIRASVPEEPADLFPPIGGSSPAEVIAAADYCPDHTTARWHLVPGGVSKRTGNAYDAFWACPEMGCKQKPVKAWVEMQSEGAVRTARRA